MTSPYYPNVIQCGARQYKQLIKYLTTYNITHDYYMDGIYWYVRIYKGEQS